MPLVHLREDELDQVEKSSGGRGRKILEKADH